MQLKSFFILLLPASMLAGNISFAQSQPVYKVPDNYQFDYEVTQALVNKKNPADPSVMHFFYAKSGDYAAAEIGGKTNVKKKLLVILTRDGNIIIFDEHKKNITVVSIRKLVPDLSGIAKWIRMDSVMAHLKEKTGGKHLQSMKTGNTKQVNGYTAEEYSLSDSNGHKISVWCAKVDFNTAGDYILGAGLGNFLKMMSGHLAAHPLLQALSQPRTMVIEIDGLDSTRGKGMDLHTLSISQNPTTIPTAGYQVNNYSNMTLPEIFQEEMKKKNN